jgi:hypothetical protein
MRPGRRALIWMAMMAAVLASTRLGTDAAATLTDDASVPDNTFMTTQTFP